MSLFIINIVAIILYSYSSEYIKLKVGHVLSYIKDIYNQKTITDVLVKIIFLKHWHYTEGNKLHNKFINITFKIETSKKGNSSLNLLQKIGYTFLR